VDAVLTTAGSFAATKIVLFVISGAATTMFVCGAVWALGRASRATFASVRSRLVPHVLHRLVERRVRKLAVHTSKDALVPGNLVRLVGVVEAENLALAAFSGAVAVVSRHEVGERGGGSVTRGGAALDFNLRLGDGSKVKVLASEAVTTRSLWLLDARPDRWSGRRSAHGWFCESRIAPGDRIEVIGQLSRAVDVNAERASDRQPGLTWTIGAGEARMTLRFATRADSDPLPRLDAAAAAS
jgi:hypothetical protein